MYADVVFLFARWQHHFIAPPPRANTLTHNHTQSLQSYMHCMQGGLVTRKLSLRLYVLRLSVCQARALWQNGRKICPNFYTTRKII